MSRLLRLFANLILSFWISQALATEEIITFVSDISVHTDGSMVVEENITVRAEGNQIKRGIYRDFPTRYRDALGNTYSVEFELLTVLRDGVNEKYHTQSLDNGIRTYIGDSNVYLDHNIYTYTIRYRTTRQLGFFDGHDELYWNVTGNGWSFPIQKASAAVRLPNQVDASEIKMEAYTGPKGAKGSDYDAWVEFDGTVNFNTTRPLRQHEGLTIVAAWPKGVVVEPSQLTRFRWLLDDNSELVSALSGILILLIYYFFSWRKVGRDPSRGVVIPEYQPPEGFSPASLRFIQRMGYDKQSFSAAIVNMAVSGYLTIREDDDGDFTLERTDKQATLAAGEQAIADSLFGNYRDSITLQQDNHSTIRSAINAHKNSLKQDYEIIHFRTNKTYLVPGFIISAGTLILAVLNIDSPDQRALAGFMSVWLAGWSLGIFSMLRGVLTSWRAFRISGEGLSKVITRFIAAIPFLAGAAMGVGVMGSGGSITLAICLGILLVINVLFYEWMKAPTQLGQKLIDRAAGFSLYLEVAEKEELNFKNPPDKTPELFERYLPYAIALGVEHQWADKFTSILSQAQATEGYKPAWYHGDHWDPGRIQGFTSTVGSAMSSAISSSSTPPGSSSGMGGGGSSGGGGGGGGGGGW